MSTSRRHGGFGGGGGGGMMGNIYILCVVFSR